MAPVMPKASSARTSFKRNLTFTDVEEERRFVHGSITPRQAVAIIVWGGTGLTGIFPLMAGNVGFGLSFTLVGAASLAAGIVLYRDRLGAFSKEKVAFFVQAVTFGWLLSLQIISVNAQVQRYVETRRLGDEVVANITVHVDQVDVEIKNLTSLIRTDIDSYCNDILDRNTTNACLAHGFANGSCGARAFMCANIIVENLSTKYVLMGWIFQFVVITNLLIILGIRIIFSIPLFILAVLSLLLFEVAPAQSQGIVIESFNVATLVVFVIITFISMYKREKRSREIFLLQRKQDNELRKKSFTIRKTKTEAAQIAAQNQKMIAQLSAAKALVSKVMKEQQTALAVYEIPHSNLSFQQEIGQGSFGTVFKGTLRGSTPVAIKTMRISKISERELELFKKELLVMCGLHHESIVALQGGVWNEGADKLCIILEFCPLGSLDSFFNKSAHSEEIHDWSWTGLRHSLATSTSRGLRYLHHELEKKLVHRDIKPANILVAAERNAKIADFGTATYFDVEEAIINADSNGADALTMTMAGTQHYCAPEVMVGARYNESCDVFSFSLVLLCLAVGDMRHVSKEVTRMGPFAYMREERPAIPTELANAGAELVKLIEHCWTHDFRKRPAFESIVTRLEACVSLGSYDHASKIMQHGSTADEARPESVLAPLPSNVATGASENATTKDVDKDALIERLRAKVAELEAKVTSLSDEIVPDRSSPSGAAKGPGKPRFRVRYFSSSQS